MKIALVHELLTMRGGAERVFKILSGMFPEAPIYTLLYDEKKLGKEFPKDRIVTSKLQKWARPIFNFSFLFFHFPLHHLLLPFFPKAAEAWDFSQYDLVISSSSAFVHGIITNGQPKHICYVNSPARYLWDRTFDVQKQAGKGFFGFLKKAYLKWIFHKLRTWDSETAGRADVLLAASKTVQRRIELYWRRQSEVVYPPVDDFWFDPECRDECHPEQKPFFLIVSTLVRYKRLDLAIAAFNKLNLSLKIVGEGPDKKRLQKLAGSTIEFLGYQPKEKVKELYKNAQATIFPGDEDFGLVPLESMAGGTPVIAFRSGGALETIIDGKTGLFFAEPTAESLAEVLISFDRKQFDPDDCKKQARQFSREWFIYMINKIINKNLQS